MLRKRRERALSTWQLLRVNSWNNLAVWCCSLEEKVRAPRPGTLGTARQSAFTPPPCRQFQLFYTNQEVFNPPSTWPLLKCWSVLLLCWMFCCSSVPSTFKAGTSVCAKRPCSEMQSHLPQMSMVWHWRVKKCSRKYILILTVQYLPCLSSWCCHCEYVH